VRKAPEEVVCFKAAYQVPDLYKVLSLPFRILKAWKMSEVDAFWRPFSWLNDGWTVQDESCHQVRVGQIYPRTQV